MTRRDLKVSLQEICDYALLEGRNTNWKNVVESISRIWEEYHNTNPKELEQNPDIAILLSNIESLLDSYARAELFGENDNTIVFKLLCIGDIYRNIQVLKF